MHRNLLALVLVILSLSACAASSAGTKQPRMPASEEEVVFSLASPDVQVERDKDALDAYAALAKAAKTLDKTDQKNFEEFGLLGKTLESRGYMPLQSPLSGKVFGPARQMVYYRKRDEHVPPLNGEAAYTGVALEFYYIQNFVEKNVAPVPGSLLPETRLHGTILLRCEPKSTGPCPISAIAIQEASIVWKYPLSGRGANSSAGGAGQGQ